MKAKKSLGQNFLKSKAALRSIIENASLEEHDIVLEIGPGKGILTEELIKKVRYVIAVEKDDRLISMLQKKYRAAIQEKKLILIHADILEFNPEKYGLVSGTYKIIANIPYYITGQLLRQFLGGIVQPSLMVLMLQKEVAQRIVAKNNKESILSLSVKAYGTPRYVETVKAKYFSPEPNVDSAIIAIENISKDFFKTFSEEKFFTVVKAGFAHKRKQLMGNLKGIYMRDSLEKTFTDCNINKKARAEDVGLLTWKLLAEKL